mgnify:CR=1 FL=1
MSASQLPDGIAENLRFLILEGRTQIARTRDYLNTPSEALAGTIAAREPYIHNLRRAIQRKIFAPRRPAADTRSARTLRAAELVAGAVEELAEECLRLVNQVSYLENDEVLFLLEFNPYFEPLLDALGRLEGALFDLDPQAALRVCRAEGRLDEAFERDLAQAIEDLEAGEHAQTQVTLLFLFRSLEEMGDILLRAGEAVLSACLGESIKVDRLWAFDEALGGDLPLEALRLNQVAETRSGSSIRSVRRSGGQDAVIVKDGRLEKLEAERACTERWRSLNPVLAPAVHEFQRLGDQGAIVYEFLPGQTFEALLLEADEVDVRCGLDRLTESLQWVWRETKSPKPTQAGYLRQLEDRLERVYAVHPTFREGAQEIGGLSWPTFSQLLQEVAALEAKVPAPFGVLIHGDLNLDNILYHREGDQVHFLDLHRSCIGDYVQDVSVFLVSPLRLRILSTALRQRLSRASIRFLSACRTFAKEEGDETFEIRLALGLARSFATSTRFLLATDLAKELFMRSRYLLERVRSSDPATFQLPDEVLGD